MFSAGHIRGTLRGLHGRYFGLRVLGLVPVLAGYRRTLNGTGTGFYVEPNAGYMFASSSIKEYDANGQSVQNGNDVSHIKVAGLAAGFKLRLSF